MHANLHCAAASMPRFHPTARHVCQTRTSGTRQPGRFLITAMIQLAAFAMPTAGAQSTDAVGLDEIIVTATRREERLHDIPVSATAFNQESLDSHGLRNVDDLTGVTPGVTFQRDGIGPNGNLNDEASNINLRGIDSSAGTSTVGIYIDDTPIQGRHLTFTSFNAFPALFDLDRVEVLRGPQGTLFGASSEGGTVRFIQPAPDLKEYKAYARGELSSTDNGAPSYEAGAALGGPLIADTLGFRLSLSDRRDGGWVNRVDPRSGAVLDRNSNSQQTLVMRAALKWAPTDRLSVTPSIYYQRHSLNDTSAIWQGLSDPPQGRFNNGNSQADTSVDPFWLGALKVEWKGSRVLLTSNTSVFSRHQHSTDDFTDFDGIIYGLTTQGGGRPPGALSTSFDTDVQNNFHQEFRWQSIDPAARLVWNAGLCYAHLNENTTEFAFDPTLNGEYIAAYGTPLCTQQVPCPGGQILTEPVYRVVDDQYAIFGEATLKSTDRWLVTAGTRVGHLAYRGNLENYGPFIGPYAGPDSPLHVTGSGGDNQVTPRGVLSYKADENNLVYLSAAKGFRGGGINGGISDFCNSNLTSIGVTSRPATYRPDDLWSYELGAKLKFLDGRLQVDSSVYTIEWNNIQQAVYLPVCSQSFVANLGKVESKGGEMEIRGRPIPPLILTASLAYVDARYTKTICAGSTPCTGANAAAAPIVTKGDSLPASPWTILASAQYSFLNEYVSLDYRLSTAQNGIESIQDPNNGVSDPTYIGITRISTLAARAGLRLRGYDLSLFGQNLTNAHPISFRNRFTTGTDLYLERSITPRTIGLTITYHR